MATPTNLGLLFSALILVADAGAFGAGAPSGSATAAPAQRSASLAVAAGSVLRTRPTIGAPVVTIVDEPTSAELVEERSGWRRIRIGSVTGWLAPDGVDDAGAARPGGRGEVDGPRLARALALLPEPTVRAEAHGLTLHAPGDEALRLERWVTVARRTLEAWPGRLGVGAVEPSGAVVFAPGDEAASDPSEAPGSSGGGVALLRLGDRTDDEIEVLLVHELSHLASERAFPRGLPIWLEEGIAEWQAREPLASDGNLLSGMLRGEVTAEREGGGRRVDFTGPLADLARLAREAEAGTLPRLELWTALSDAEFSSPAARATNYALAGSFVRFLFEADSERAADVRELLAAAAAGERNVDAGIDRRLGDAGELDRAFRAWLVEELDRQLVPELP